MLYKKPNKCFITDLETSDFIFASGMGFNCITYKVSIHGVEVPLMFSPYPSSWTDDISIYKSDDIEKIIELELKPYKHILCGLIFNNKLKPSENTFFNIEFVKKIITEHIYPNTIEEKLDNLFLKLIELQSFDGEEIDLLSLLYKDDEWKGLYFKKVFELNFYIQTLIEEGLISNPENMRLENEGKFVSVIITFKGLLHLIELKDKGKKSNKCFVAMSFNKEEDDIFFQAILPACNLTGFDAKRIDYENYSSELTINDAIISLIKECKFCIADFTRQREGVYFEAGYAAGRGLDVIYTCHDNYFGKSHFDTNHFPHIIYKNNEELKNALIDKINVRIKE